MIGPWTSLHGVDTLVCASRYIGLSTWTHLSVDKLVWRGHIGPWQLLHRAQYVDTSVRASWYLGLSMWTHWSVDKSARRGHIGPCKLVHRAQHVDTLVRGQIGTAWTHRSVQVGTSGSVRGHIGAWTNRHSVDTPVRASWYIRLSTSTHRSMGHIGLIQF